jgi:hypothetical protein
MFKINNFKVKEMNANLSGQALLDRVLELRVAIQAIPPETLASRTDSFFTKSRQGEGYFALSLFNEEIHVEYPSILVCNKSGDKLPVFLQALILYYFSTSTGAPLSGNWVSFADLPDGRMYAQAFQGYSGDQVAKLIGTDLGRFHAWCKRAGGSPCAFADAAYSFQGLPRMPLALAYWLGEDEFPSTCKVLFDSAARNYLPIDACAIIGSQLVKNVLRSKMDSANGS